MHKLLSPAVRFSTAAILFGFATLLFNSCGPAAPTAITITGEAQGTTYNITYYDTEQRNFKAEMDEFLAAFDQVLSTYQSESIISQLNRSTEEYTLIEDTTGYFVEVFLQSFEVCMNSGGTFDPTVFPLVKSWGFGLEKAQEMDSNKVDSLLFYVGFTPNRISIVPELETAEGVQKGPFLRKANPGTQVEFNAIAQGFSVDRLAIILEKHGVTSYLVELGGEMRVGTAKPNGDPWKVGIDKPIENPAERTLQATVKLTGRGIATSGNYRKFYEKDGMKYSHTISPGTGFPVQHNLLSATVIANECSMADAYATAFMVMGKDRTLDFLENHADLDLQVYLIYSGEDGSMQTYLSPALEQTLEELTES